MSGGEVAGLALGAIALASLFQTCIEMFDCFELAKNCSEDQKLASLKISLFHERLQTWGRDLKILEPGEEDATLRKQWPGTSEAIIKSLLALKATLEKSESLVQKYKASAHSTYSVKLRRRTSWAIHDRNKLDRLVQDISFLIDNIEIITGRMSLQQGPGEIRSQKRTDVSYTQTLPLRDIQYDARMPTDRKSGEKEPDVSDSDSVRSREQHSSSEVRSRQEHDTQGPAIITVRRNQQVVEDGAISVIGGVDPTGHMIVENNFQKISGKSFAVIGTISGRALDRAQVRQMRSRGSTDVQAGKARDSQGWNGNS